MRRLKFDPECEKQSLNLRKKLPESGILTGPKIAGELFGKKCFFGRAQFDFHNEIFFLFAIKLKLVSLI